MKQATFFISSTRRIFTYRNFFLPQQLFAKEDFCTGTRVCNIFETENVIKL